MANCFMKYDINPEYCELKDFIFNINHYFESQGDIIYKGRNMIKKNCYNNDVYIVKFFKEPCFLNKIVYSCLRPSKSRKSYINAMRLGEFSPQPVAYIDFYKSGLLFQNFFISKEFDYDFTIREPLLDKNFADRSNIFSAFARFTARLHEKQIFHHDYSPGNILIKKEKESYQFKIVDVNRMSFLVLDRKKRMKSFARLWADDEDLVFIVKEYVTGTNENERDCIRLALRYSAWQKKKVGLKKEIRARGKFLKSA